MKDKKKIVIIGADSYLAEGIEKYITNCDIYKFDYINWVDNMQTIKEANCVINFSISPKFSATEIDLTDVIDVQIANAIKDYNVQFVFISSRKVYGISDDLVIHRETDELCGQDYYAVNKIRTENELQKILGNRLTILRVSNIIAEPVNRKGYKTFVGWISEEFLNNGTLEVTQNSKIIKDFITKKYLHRNIAYIVENNITGIFNLSSGFGISVKEIIAGYIGEYAIFAGDNTKMKDQFILDNTKIKNITNFNITKTDIYKELSKYKKKLLKMKNKNYRNC